jgi:hypothetical protein
MQITARSMREGTLSKIANLMKRAVFVSGVTGALIIGATATAPAYASTAHASKPAGSAPVAESPTTQSYGDCKYNLEYVFGYEVTNTRDALCLAASAPVGSATTRVGICTTAMIATGVAAIAAFTSCLSATA